MSDGDPTEAMRQAAREVLRELLPDLVGQLRAPETSGHANGNGLAKTNGHAAASRAADPVPRVPAPPVAAVLRPSTWTGPAVPGEVIGDGAPAPPATPVGSPPGAHTAAPVAQVAAPVAQAAPPAPEGAEAITLDSDADLQRFVASLLRRFENPRERRALRSGAVRFTLRRTPAAGRDGGVPAPPAMHFDKGAVTERIVREAAAAGARLVLARRAVLTPLARDQARALRVAIEREDT